MKKITLLALLPTFFTITPPTQAQDVYTIMRPPSSRTGIIFRGTWWTFDNSGDPKGKRFKDGGNYIDTGIKPKRVSSHVILVNGVYACKNAPDDNWQYYGQCGRNGWVRSKQQPF